MTALNSSLANLSRIDPYLHGTLQAVIETPRGSRNKYAYDAERRCFQLKKLLPAGMVCPFDFGFIPSTRCGDGAELDALVLQDEPAFPGCVIGVRPVGVLLQEDRLPDGTVRRNDRLITVETHSLLYAHVMDVQDIPTPLPDQLRTFFETYPRLLGEKESRVLSLEGRAEAERLIAQARAQYPDASLASSISDTSSPGGAILGQV